MDDLDRQMYLVQRFSSRKTSSSFCLIKDRRYTLVDLGLESGRKSMVWFQ